MKKFKVILVGTILLGVGSAIVYHCFSYEVQKSAVDEKNQNVPVEVISSMENNEEKEELVEEVNDSDLPVAETKEDSVSNNEVVKQESKPKSNNSKDVSKNEDKKAISDPKENISQEASKPVDVPKQENVSTPKEIEVPTKSEETKKPEVIKFYESITHGKKDFMSEQEALARGEAIVKLELKIIMDYNENHEDFIQPDVNYYRVYPSIKDENGNTWYYIHFFCQSGKDKDDMLKRLYEKYLKYLNNPSDDKLNEIYEEYFNM